MSLTVCIPDLIERGEIPAGKAKRVREFYDARVAEYSREMAAAAAETKATLDTMQWLSAETLQKARQRGLQVKAQSGWLGDMRMTAGDGPLPVKAAVNRMARIDKKMDALRGRYFSTLDAMLAKHRRNLVGELRNRSDLEDVGRALFGESVQDLNARELADGVSSVMELARQRFNQAGGRIGKRENFGLPQSHDSRLVRAVPYEEWRAFPSVDRVQVLDIETGDVATGIRRETILRAVYETIRTEGANKAKPGQMFAGALANRRGDPRVLDFENFDDWMAYQQRFGGSDNIYDIIVGHLSSMARDTALMEDMGPNPAATLRFYTDSIDKSVKERGVQRDIDRLTGSKKKLERLYGELTGGNKAAENRRLALGFSALRAQQTAAKLGSAMLSVPPDFATMMMTARFNGIPAMKTLKRYTELWNPADDADRRLAVRLGLVTQDWLGLSSSSARYLGEELTGEVSRRMADAVIRGSGLSRHTRNAQWAFGMEFLSHLTQMKDRAFANLDPALQRAMKRYGIGEADWNAYRATPVRIERGSDWIFPTDAADARVGDKVLEMVLSETDHAIVVPDVRTRTFMHSYLPAGTWLGEIGKSTFLFKGFPMAVLSLHGRRMMEQSGLEGKAGYAVPLMLTMIVGGALAAQLKTVAAGKDPQPMNDARFVGKAVVQSGGLGLFGDLLFNSENSYGGGLAQTLAGPLLGQTIPNAADATVGNALRAVGVGEGDPEFVKDLWKAAEAEIPGRNLWYTRLAWQRLIADQISAYADPDIEKARRRMRKRAKKEGTAYFWEPGEIAPERAPDFANAIGNEAP